MIRNLSFLFFVALTSFLIGAGLVRHHILPAFPVGILRDALPFVSKHTEPPMVNEDLQVGKVGSPQDAAKHAKE